MTAVASVAFLLLHVRVKLALDHVDLIAALIPFGLGVTGTSAASSASARWPACS